ncbi:MAG: Outer membrane protein [uncultured Sulfurovum sp.]|uniref:Outer membrane protein n=1 Tax=uncultured Sulfurovum sp. TaxID=269237 RepID=A0A6S6UCV7_9BACT|nr:MAG: Outer membrane protein [uncultured Sulfurovum sp.]
MSKIIIFYFLIIFSILDAQNIEQEIGINIGMNSTKNEDGNKFKNPTVGLSYQDNKYIISPRVDIDYTKVNNDYANSLVKVSVNGVYEYENNTYTIPYALAGVGYEYVSGATKGVFESNAFVQGGAGVRVDLEQDFKARLEGKVLKIIGGNDEGNEFIVTAGVSMPVSKLFGETKKAIPPPRVVVPFEPILIPTPMPVKREVVVVNNDNNECPIKISAPDLDRDGIPNNIDQCPATPCDFTVDAYGCPIKTTLKINFASGSADIRPSSEFQVSQFAEFLLKNRGSIVKITGHTDSQGSFAKNVTLSQRRANSIVQALRQRGISSARLEAFGKGENEPLTSNATAAGRAINRRIEAELFYPKGR